jgi:hypothetical protein
LDTGHALITAIFLLKCFYPVKIFVLLLLLLLLLLAKMAEIEGAIGRQFQSLSIVFVCAVNTKLASLFGPSSFPGPLDRMRPP